MFQINGAFEDSVNFFPLKILLGYDKCQQMAKLLFVNEENIPAFLECFTNIKNVTFCEHNSVFILSYVKS